MGERILLVEDDSGSRRRGWPACWHRRRLRGAVGENRHAGASIAVVDRVPDLVLLDLGLPDAIGVASSYALTSGRATARCFVVVVTARTDEADAVRALDGGADDFVTKPFRPVELCARLRAHLRRRVAAGRRNCGPVRSGSTRTPAGPGSGIGKSLRPKEGELLAVLVADAGRAVRRETLMDQVWDEHWSGSTKTLDVHIASVRHKLAEAGDRWDRIATLRGFGYRFELD